jgi:hypothetical protein
MLLGMYSLVAWTLATLSPVICSISHSEPWGLLIEHYDIIGPKATWPRGHKMSMIMTQAGHQRPPPCLLLRSFYQLVFVSVLWRRNFAFPAQISLLPRPCAVKKNPGRTPTWTTVNRSKLRGRDFWLPRHLVLRPPLSISEFERLFSGVPVHQNWSCVRACAVHPFDGFLGMLIVPTACICTLSPYTHTGNVNISAWSGQSGFPLIFKIIVSGYVSVCALHVRTYLQSGVVIFKVDNASCIFGSEKYI